MTKDYFLYEGETKKTFDLPPAWTVLEHTRFEEDFQLPLIKDLVKRALCNPVSTPRLSEIALENKDVAIIVDDPARATPIHEMLPPVLAELRKAGAHPDRITIVVALGTHRFASEKELETKLGKTVLKNYRVVQHDCHSKDLIPIGRLKTGAQVSIDPFVAKANVTIGMGSIFPHPMNGFGGGAKILFPGVANFDAILQHHFHFTPEKGSILGRTDQNPFYEEVCRMAQAGGLDFIINGIFDARERVVDVVAGHFKAAHMAGIQKSRRNYGLNLKKSADVTLVSAEPYDEGPQIIKPIIPASLMTTRPNGSVIVLSRCPAGMPEPMLRAFDRVFEKNPQHTGRFAVEAFKSGKPMAEGAIDFNCAMFFALVCASRNRITIVSEDLNKNAVERLGFHYAPSLESAIFKEAERQPGATVNIFPLGGLLLPEVSSVDDFYAF